MVPPFQAIMASSGDAFTQELCARGQLWETDRIKNHLCVPRLNHDLTQEKAENKILAFSEPMGIFAHASGQPVVRITLDTAAGTSIVSDSRLLRELHPYHGPSVYGIGSTATPVDTIGTLLLFNASQVVTLMFSHSRSYEITGTSYCFTPTTTSSRSVPPMTLRYASTVRAITMYITYVLSPLPVGLLWNTMPSRTTCA
jgi:hypothetical protein